MQRGKFIKNLAALIAVAASAKELVTLAPKAEVLLPDVPGIGGTAFKIMLDRRWFEHGDIITTGITQYHISKRLKDYDEAVEVTNKLNPTILHLYDSSFPTLNNNQGTEFRKVCSVYGEL